MVYRMLVIGIGALLSLSATAPPTKVCGCSAVPSFEALATPPEHVALPKLDLSSHPIGPRYRTILRRAVASQPPTWRVTISSFTGAAAPRVSYSRSSTSRLARSGTTPNSYSREASKPAPPAAWLC